MRRCDGLHRRPPARPSLRPYPSPRRPPVCARTSVRSNSPPVHTILACRPTSIMISRVSRTTDGQIVGQLVTRCCGPRCRPAAACTQEACGALHCGSIAIASNQRVDGIRIL